MRGIREAYRKIKDYKLAHQAGTVRRIDRVHPVPNRRVVAITFDDGPCAGPARPGTEPITAGLLNALKDAGARGTFDVIGSTSFKYPDTKGSDGGPYWNGIGFDHYPEFGADHLGGAVNQPDLVRRIVAEGNELSNHGFGHTAFGPNKYPYSSRRYLSGFDAVVADLEALDDYILSLTGVKMRLGRPPHYIDKTADGFTSYDAYRALGYTYLGAHFDGGGWQRSSGDFETDVRNMVSGLENALAADSDSLNGSIIFHKDGYNMSREAPALEGLRRQLALLRRYEYDVVTVAELTAMSEFTDLSPSDPLYVPAKALLRAGYAVTFADNRVRPDQALTVGDLHIMATPTGTSGPIKTGDADGVWRRGLFQVVAQRTGRAGPFARNRDRGAPVKLSELIWACEGIIDFAPGDEERARRMSLLRQVMEVKEDPVTATRSQALSLLAVAFLGVDRDPDARLGE